MKKNYYWFLVSGLFVVFFLFSFILFLKTWVLATAVTSWHKNLCESGFDSVYTYTPLCSWILFDMPRTEKKIMKISGNTLKKFKTDKHTLNGYYDPIFTCTHEACLRACVYILCTTIPFLSCKYHTWCVSVAAHRRCVSTSYSFKSCKDVCSRSSKLVLFRLLYIFLFLLEILW